MSHFDDIFVLINVKSRVRNQKHSMNIEYIYKMT